MSDVGPLTLFSIASDKLRRFSHVLGDIGSIPLHIIEHVLVECSAETLSRIEDETATGVCQRDLSKETWPLWYFFVKHELQNTIKKNEILRHITMSRNTMDRSSSLSHLVGTNVTPLDYKAVYHSILDRKRVRLDTSGQHVRKRFKEEQDKKMSRCVQVIDPIPVARRNQKAAVTTTTSSTCRLSQKLGIKRPQVHHGMKRVSFQRQQRSLIKQHRSNEKRKVPTVRQLQQPTESKPGKRTATSATLSEASLFQ